MKAVTELYDEMEIDRLAQQKIAGYFNESKTYFDRVGVSDERKSELMRYAQRMMKRRY